MLRPEQLDSYITVARMPGSNGNGDGHKLCTQCGEDEATVNICKSCLTSIAEKEPSDTEEIVRDISGAFGELQIIRISTG